jgi:hypothetical protein
MADNAGRAAARPHTVGAVPLTGVTRRCSAELPSSRPGSFLFRRLEGVDRRTRMLVVNALWRAAKIADSKKNDIRGIPEKNRHDTSLTAVYEYGVILINQVEAMIVP